VVEVKEVAVLEIRFLDNNSEMTHSNNSHTEEVEEANLKAVLQIQVMHHIKEKRRLVRPLVCLTFLQDIHM
jgi:hypothetical protein